MSDPLLERVISADYRSGTAKGACRGYCPSDPLSPGPGCRLRSPREPIRGSIRRHVSQGWNETLDVIPELLGLLVAFDDDPGSVLVHFPTARLPAPFGARKGLSPKKTREIASPIRFRGWEPECVIRSAGRTVPGRTGRSLCLPCSDP